MRYALVLEYDGRPFHGWQRQPQSDSVQQHVESALSSVADRPVAVTCAGRTDTGVHATAQVVHFDTDADRRDRAWRLGTNTHLPPAIGVLWAGAVGDGFHARYSAVDRTYTYLIENRLSRSVLLDGRAWWVRQPLDISAMRRAAQYLLGEHDFSAFRAAACQAKTASRFVAAIDIGQRGEFVTITITANAFLHNMVRIVAGALVSVGSGEQRPAWVDELLRGRDRTHGAQTAPPGGLYLTEVRYARPHALPSRRNTVPAP